MTPGERLDAAHVCVKPACADAHHGAAWVPLYPGGVGGDIPDGDSLKNHKLDDPPEDAVPQRDSGKACCVTMSVKVWKVSIGSRKTDITISSTP